MQSLVPAFLLLVLPLAAHDEEHAGKVPTRPAVIPSDVAGAIVIVSYKDAPQALPNVVRTREEAKARAQEALEAARDEHASFDDIVAKYSDDPGNRGRMGIMTRGQGPLPSIEEALYGMEVGQVSDVIESEFGYLIVSRMTARAAVAQILIAHRGATGGTGTATRTKEEAKALADQARQRVVEGKEDFALVAGEVSDDPSKGDGGKLGAVSRGQMESAFEEAAFALDPDEISEVIETAAGYRVLKGMPLKNPLHYHASHILLAYKGARDAPATVARTKEEAREAAQGLLERLRAGEDFARLAGEFSDCPSSDRGGDLGGFLKGQRDPAFEEAVFALDAGETTGIVETPSGLHIIRRTE